MWRNPKYYPTAETTDAPGPPPETGKRLATFPRGQGVEMRVTLSEFQGRPFIGLRVWEADHEGRFWPVKGKGCSIRLSEAGDLADVLRAVADDRPARREDHQRQPQAARQEPARHERPASRASAPATPPWAPEVTTEGQGGFNEFGN